MVFVLFVCLGNICRSPTAEGVFGQMVKKHGMSDRISIDSAGTGDWHVGNPPDQRAIDAALNRGIDIRHLCARRISSSDFFKFDYILAMDRQNLNSLKRDCPGSFDGHLGLFLEFLGRNNFYDVPDPYYSQNEGFELVLDLIFEAGENFFQHIVKHHL
ncbi:MAG: phosphotyrosine protein phosphatase [Cellvibrionales bacterium TMED49]|nr:MAG: phosphotyrosine protein phosphatase [Cellvibrionales bacterium TMED49]|tara:strand:- start:636 stop:1109 length:474 start_codon:yes stop_codon:yes gene_type:complete